MILIGYAQVSTEDQNLALQYDARHAAGCASIHDDKLSGASADRPGLNAALDACESGDMLVAWKPDRVGRSMVDLVNLINGPNKRGVGLKIPTGQGAAVDTTRPEGILIFAVFAAVAEFEARMTRERTKAGMAAANRRGRRLGPPLKLTPEKRDMAEQLIAEGKGKAVTARMGGVDPATLRRNMCRYSYFLSCELSAPFLLRHVSLALA